MADTMQFDLVSPERKLASVEATSVQIPGMEGEMTAMPNHTAFLTTLRPGFVTVTNGADVTEFFVTGGFAEVSESGASVLAEHAVPKADVTADTLNGALAEAEEAVAIATADSAIGAAQRVNDIKTLIAQLGY